MIGNVVGGLGLLALAALCTAIWDYRRGLRHVGDQARHEAFLEDRYPQTTRHR